MRWIFFLIFAFLFSFLFVQCKNDWRSIEILQKKVEAVHDEPMAKLDVLEAMQTRAMREFVALDSTVLRTKNRRDSLGLFVRQSQKAHDAMFDWMAQYRSPQPEKMDAKAAEIYLDDQLKKANSMRSNVLSAVAEGERLFIKQ